MSLTAGLTLVVSLMGCGGGGGDTGTAEATTGIAAQQSPSETTVTQSATVMVAASGQQQVTTENLEVAFFSGNTGNREPTTEQGAPVVEANPPASAAEIVSTVEPVLVAANNQTVPEVQGQPETAAPDLAALTSPRSTIPAHAPRLSDVILSPRFDRPEAVATARAYGATRTEWSYITKPGAIAALKLPGITNVGGAVNNNTPTPGNAGAALDFEGVPIVAPWMKSWGAIWNSCANQPTMDALKKAASDLIAAGVTSIQMDDAGMQLDAEFFGAGDFSPASLSGFGTWVAQQLAAGNKLPLTSTQAAQYGNWLRSEFGIKSSAEYLSRRNSIASTAAFRQYMRSTVTACLLDLKSSLKTTSGSSIPLSLNIHTPYPWGSNSFLATLSDYVVGEVDNAHDEFANVYFFSNWLNSINRRWVPVFPIASKTQLRQKIAIAYATGAVPMVPWDMWIPPAAGTTVPPPRFFGSASDFSDLFQFAKLNGRLLDDHSPLSRLNLIVYTDNTVTADANAQLARLAELQVPYNVSLRTNSWAITGPRSTSPDFRTLRLSANIKYPDEGYALVRSNSDINLADLAVTSSPPPGVGVVVTANLATPNRRVVHLVRRVENSIASGPVMLSLNRWTLPAGTTHNVKILRPGLQAVELGRINVTESGRLQFNVPDFAEWSIVEIDRL